MTLETGRILDPNAAIMDDYHRHFAEVVKVRLQRRINPLNLRLRSWWEEDPSAMVIELEAFLAGQSDQEYVEFPKTWWDAFKDRWFPRWAKERWPVEIEIHRKGQRLCPHIHADPAHQHVEFLVKGTVQ